MPKAIWNDTLLAKSDHTEMVEGNHYFPPESVNQEFLNQTDTSTVCPWKGQATYYSIQIDGKTNVDAAFTYHTPNKPAHHIKDHVAFWRGVKIEE